MYKTFEIGYKFKNKWGDIFTVTEKNFYENGHITYTVDSGDGLVIADVSFEVINHFERFESPFDNFLMEVCGV